MTETPVVPWRAVAADNSAFRVQSNKGDVRFLTKAVQPPSIVYVEQDDVLSVIVGTQIVVNLITVTYRLLRTDGELVLGQFTFPITTTFTPVTHSEQLAEGFLLNVSIVSNTPSVRGATFARVFLTSPGLGNAEPSYVLMADYITQTQSPAHPNGRVLDPLEGPGLNGPVTVAAPALGTNWALLFPNFCFTRVITVQYTFTTSAVGGARNSGIFIQSGGFSVYETLSPSTQAASTSTLYFGAQLTPHVSGTPGAIQNIALPPGVICPGGSGIGSVTQNLSAGDAYTGIVIGIERWLGGF